MKPGDRVFWWRKVKGRPIRLVGRIREIEETHARVQTGDGGSFLSKEAVTVVRVEIERLRRLE